MPFLLRTSPAIAARGTANHIRCLSTTSPCRRSSTGHRAEALAWPATPNPSPYEIFNIPSNSAYDKRRFAELVKLYHPDRHQQAACTIDTATRLDRYRLVVLANELLSNPAKRRAYDQYGLGWSPDTGSGATAPAGMHASSRQTAHHWQSPSANSAWRNATWEDWEAWHEQQAAGAGAGTGSRSTKQTPIYMSNGAFATLVVVLLGVASAAHYFYMDDQAASLAHSRQQENKRIMRMLALREQAAADMSREERLLSFIESAGYELDLKEEDKCQNQV
ncbi:hypothetical protein BROUX41_002581 [Berkeleyomyces rouxiae]